MPPPTVDNAGVAPPSRKYRTREGTGGTTTGVRDAGVRSDEGVRGGGKDIVHSTYLYVQLTRFGWGVFRGIILNRTYGTYKNLYISLFLITTFGPTYYGPP